MAEKRRRGALAPILLVVMGALGAPVAGSATTPAQVLLARPLPPADEALFGPTAYPDAPVLVPASGGEPSRSAVSQMLDSYLEAEHPADPHAQEAARAVFNDPTAEQKIPSHSLRAGLATLKGTLGEPAIDFILRARTLAGSAKVRKVKFASLPPSLVARVTPSPVVEQRIIEVNARYAAESPFMFTSTLAHEALHQDFELAHYEEAVAASLDQLVYLHQLARHPGLARAGTELVRRRNSNALARLNSGMDARLGLYGSNRDAAVLPGSPTFTETSWWRLFDEGDRTRTSGNALLGEYLQRIQEPGGPTCSYASFDKALLDCIDQNQGALTAAELAAAADAMKLDTSAAVAH